MQHVVQDLRYGLRTLLKNPGSTLVAVLALSLGIGANTAIFSVVDTLLLKPLAYKDADRLVAVWESKPSKGMLQEPVSPPDFRDWADQNRVFDGMAALRSQPSTLTGADLPERIETAQISPSMFNLLGVNAALGRVFLPGEDRPGRDRVAVIGDGLWRRRFGADANILGKPLQIDGGSYTVVGVAPPGFQLLDTASEIWLPYAPDARELSRRAFRVLKVIAHLKPGVSLAQARAEMASIQGRLEREYADTNTGYGANLVPLRDQFLGDIRPTLWMLAAAVVFVLLIACANVANLLLARAGGREKEIAVRTSLGANTRRLVRQLLTESVLLSVIGGGLGLLLAWWGVQALSGFAPASLPRLREIAIDGRVLVFTLGIAVLTGILFGLVPALAGARSDLNSILKTSGRSATGNRGRARVRNALVVCEIASSVVLLIGAGLLLRSFAHLADVNPGFRADHVLTMQISLPEIKYSGEKIGLFYKQLIDRVQNLPGVQMAGIARNLPLSGADVSLNFTMESRPVLPAAEQPRAKYRAASAAYFSALGIPLIQGRTFDAGDGERTPPVAIVNQMMARLFWPDQNPIGKRIKAGSDDDDSPWCSIVGVVGDVKHKGLDADSNPEMYYHYLQVPPTTMNFVERTMTLVVRTSTSPAAIASAVRGEVRNLDPDQPVFNVKTMEDLVQGSIAQPRFRALLLAVFAAVALILAAVGLYGVMACLVTQRTNELGVRAALGARKADLLKLVVGHGARLAAFGILIGVALAFGLMRVISRLLFGVNAVDPATFTAIPLLILAVALLASYLPALRAARVDPVVALRNE